MENLEVNDAEIVEQNDQPVQKPARQFVGYIVLYPNAKDEDLPEPMIGVFKKPTPAQIKKLVAMGWAWRDAEESTF
jgi:hypothetical protein